MKKWFALFLVYMVFMACIGGMCAEGKAAEPITFDMFYSEYGMPYQGEWECYDNSLYLYLPTELEKVELSNEMQASGILAIYSDTNDQGDSLKIQISKQGKKESIEAIIQEFYGVYSYAECIEINGILFVMTMTDDHTLYMEALLNNGEAYGIQVYISNVELEEESMQAMYITGMLYSLATAELEIDEEREEALREEVPVRMSSEVRIQFEYNDGKEEDIDQLNQMLAAMELTDVDVEDFSVYLCTTKELEQGNVVGITYRCGLDSGILVCKNAAFEKTYRYQIATEVFEKADEMEDGMFVNYWCEKYPELKLSTVLTYDFDSHTAMVVVYFEEIVE